MSLEISMQNTFRKVFLSSLVSLISVEAFAETTYHRLSWDEDGATSAVIGFSPDGTSSNAYLQYGYSTDETSWSTASVTSSQTFDSSLESKFIRLTDLTEDSAVYYRVCDDDGCGDRFWFRTAPSDASPYVIIAGGDTRTGWTTRQEGNELLAKIRPLAVMHGGDYTDNNSASEIESFLEDWELTYSSDTIDGIDYKRIYPLIPAHGNHEDDNFSTLCEVFGVDYNQDGNCDTDDTYGTVNVSPLLRIYTLNSQFMNSGYSSYATTMNDWLIEDLTNNGDSITWRFAQYHKPMFPHYSGKSDNSDLFDWWAQLFYDNAMNLVVESDTHINKMTYPVAPASSDFETATSGGTVYVGEGSWGAPARSADDAKTWTIDLSSIQQFKVIQVTASELVVRTAEFDDTAATLTLSERDADSIVLPDDVNWWSANEVGEALTLTPSSTGLSSMDSDDSDDDSSDDSSDDTESTSGEVSLTASADVFISETNSTTNYNDSTDGLLADGEDTTYGELATMIKFEMSSILDCATVSSVTLQLNVTDSSSDTYRVSTALSDWDETTATWSSVSGTDQAGTQLASFSPSDTGTFDVDLSDSDIIATWLSEGNMGLIITSDGATDGVDMTSKETGQAAVLNITYENATDCEVSEVTNSTGSAVIFGTAQEDETLTVTVSDDNGTDEATLVYSWIHSDNGEVGTEASYTIQSSDVDGTLNVNVTYSDDAGFSEDITSDSTDTIVAVTTEEDDEEEDDRNDRPSRR
jgi:hypothetical protein